MSKENLIQKTLGKIALFSAKNPNKIFLLSLILFAIALFGASMVQMEMGMDLYLDSNSETLLSWSDLKSTFNKGNTIFVIIESDNNVDLYEPENARLISDLYMSFYDNLDMVSLVTSFVHPVKAGLGMGQIPSTRELVIQSVVETMAEHRTNEQVIFNLHPGARNASLEENNVAIIQVQYGEFILPDYVEDQLFGFLPADKNAYVKEKIEYLISQNELSNKTNITITGPPVFESAAFALMLPEIIFLFSIAFLIIIVTLFIVMKNKLQKNYQVIYPLAVVLLAVFSMVGAMGFLGFNFNAIMLGVMPVALGLGIDYALQIHSRYLDERRKGLSAEKAAVVAAKFDGYALFIAFATTVVGLTSLLFALVPPVRQFGLTASISILVSMILSVTLLISLIVKFDAKKKLASNKSSDLFIEKSAKKLGLFVFKNAKIIVLVFSILILLGAAAYPFVKTQTDMLDYWPQIQERQDIRELKDLVPAPNIMYVVSIKDNIHKDFDALVKISEFEHALESNDFIVTPISPVRAVEMTSEEETIAEILPDVLFERLQQRTRVDRPPVASQPFENHPTKFITQIYVEDVSGAAEREVIDFVELVASQHLEGMDFYVTGNLVVNRNVIENVTAGLTRTTLISFILGLILLTILLSSLKYSSMLIFSVSASSVLFAAGGMFLFNIPWNPLTVTTASIILGIGIDYAIHIFERFKEELVLAKSKKIALANAISAKARPILGSGITTMLGFGVLYFSDFPVLYEFGAVIVIAMLSSLFLSFLFLPALLSLGKE